MGKLLRYESPRVCVLSVTGEDAFTYLQSQFSNDLQRDVEQPVTYGLFLNRKGKVQADSFILRRDEEAFLLVSYFADPAQLRAIVEANLIADEVEIEDVSDRRQLVTLWGDETLLDAYLPSPGSFRELNGALTFRGRRMAGPHVEALVPANQFWPDDDAPMDSGADSIEMLNALNARRIRDGLPAVPFDIGPDDLPQEGGDLACAAVSYTKGCYLGQEVMARLHAMGKAQRALFRIRVEGPANCHDPVFAGEKKVGEIRSITPLDESNCLALALLKRRHAGGGNDLFAGEAGGVAVTVEAEI